MDRCGQVCRASPDETGRNEELLIEKAMEGQTVARLKGGDPFISAGAVKKHGVDSGGN